MGSLRLQTKFLLTVLLVSAGLTGAALLVVRHSVEQRVRQQILEDLDNSVQTFDNFQRQRQITLARSAELLADLPNVRALMTTRDAATIQDASQDTWHLAGSDLLVLADSSDHVMAIHALTPGLTAETAQGFLAQSLKPGEARHWWYENGHLYEVFLQPIYFGHPAENRLLGHIALGYEIDHRIVDEISRVAASQVAFSYDNELVKSSLSSTQETELSRLMPDSGGAPAPRQVRLGDEQFLATSVSLSSDTSPVQLTVLKSLDQATLFLSRLNRELIATGLAAVLGGSLLVFLISNTFTRPLKTLVSGVRALERGDFAYPLDSSGGDEVAEVAVAFDRMRSNLQNTQRDLLESERLATIGRMASSISHDLRHSLAAIVANAEFLCESRLTSAQREDLYSEVRLAVDQMTDLIESLLEFSRARESLRPSFGNLQLTLQRVVQIVRARPEYHRVRIDVHSEGSSDGWFDSKKMERVFQNLILNACEAVPRENGYVRIDVRNTEHDIELRFSDNGPGIPAQVRHTLFEPFVSFDKENGTGLGLTVVQKIVEDHGGTVVVESTSPAGSVFKVTLPLHARAGQLAAEA